MISSTSKFKVIEIIYNNNNFAIAKGYWDGQKEKISIACRWHEPDGIGYPQTFGKPQWMLLPGEGLKVDMLDTLSDTPKIVLSFS
ncbi:hypothetical protein ABIE61_003793 [Marinobacterium sp. MBR-111]|jgi:hypothetical protein|uniref:hypothetical protein n=1 Tax=Marinobacterium sp. MBR-111 TaxID=3156463 RepID=UPI003397E4DC